MYFVTGSTIVVIISAIIVKSCYNVIQLEYKQK